MQRSGAVGTTRVGCRSGRSASGSPTPSPRGCSTRSRSYQANVCSTSVAAAESLRSKPACGLHPMPRPAEGKSPTGPFGLADAERTAGILRDAGFSDIRRTAIEFTVDLPEDAIVDDEQLRFMGVAESDMYAARRAMDGHMAQFRLNPEVSRFPLAFQIFEARRT